MVIIAFCQYYVVLQQGIKHCRPIRLNIIIGVYPSRPIAMARASQNVRWGGPSITRASSLSGKCYRAQYFSALIIVLATLLTDWIRTRWSSMYSAPPS